MTEGHTERLETALDGKYRIERKLGEGGMASVYLAEDIKHKRKVALKILRPELAAVIGAERFLTEITTTANLQHPHILPLFDSGEADGFLYYVMPFIDGETLKERIEREQQLGVDEAIRIAQSVADALDYAHRAGVIHRDIKPANILLHDGRPVVADFGIALAVSAAGGGRMTETGLSLGTPHYMSPEQASADRDLSARSDVYSLGCVLYEMLAGQPPHTGPSAQSILVRILTEDPRPITELRRTVPPNVAAVIAKSIEKLPADRFDSARQFMDALGDADFTYAATSRALTGSTAAKPAAPVVAPAAGWDLKSKALAGAVVTLAGLSAWLGFKSDPVPLAPVMSFVALDSAQSVTPILGPEGSIAYVQRRELFYRPPGALEATSIYGPGNIMSASFSPDGEWVGFTEVEGGLGPEASSILRKIPAGGGPVATLWSSESGFAVSLVWADDGYLYFGAVSGRASVPELRRVAEVGGDAEAVFTGGFPSDVLPGGNALLISMGTSSVVLDLESGDTATVVVDGAKAQWSSTGHLVYEHESGALWSVPFDAKRLKATGAPAPVLDGVAISGPTRPGQSAFALSRSGSLAYRAGDPAVIGGGGDYTFSFADLNGRLERIPIEASDHADAKLSPDGTRVVYTRNEDLWVFDLDLGTNDSLTAGRTGMHNPVWSPGGDSVAYRGSDGHVWARPADRSAEPVRMNGTGEVNPTQWLEDGTVLFSSQGRNPDVFSVKVEEGAAPVEVLHADWAEEGASVSPDGAWISYVSSRDGTRQVYVRSWPRLENEVRVSEGEGSIPQASPPLWSPDGARIYYVQGGSHFAAMVDTDDGFRVLSTEPTALSMAQTSVLDVAPDGRLLIATSRGRQQSAADDGPPAVERIVVITNWFTQLRQRLGEGN